MRSHDHAAKAAQLSYAMRVQVLSLGQCVTNHDLSGVLKAARDLMFGYGDLMMEIAKTVGAFVKEERRK